MRLLRVAARLTLTAVVGTTLGTTASATPPAPLTGFTFTAAAAQFAGIDPDTALRTLLDRLDPDVVRLPVYWSDVQRTRGQDDFTVIDDELAVVSAHDRGGPAHLTRVILVVGVRNVAFPELFVPDWVVTGGVVNAADAQRLPEFREYVSATVARHAHDRLLDAWQVENEALDWVTDAGPLDPTIPAGGIADEVALVHSLDPRHPVVVTTYDSSTLGLDEQALTSSESAETRTGPQPAGHPDAALHLGDVLGLDAYVITATHQAEEVSALRRIGWKAEELQFWAQRARQAGRPLWVTEMQAAPFLGTEGFGSSDLLRSAEAYRDARPAMVLLWGEDVWLTAAPWLDAAVKATAILRGGRN